MRIDLISERDRFIPGWHSQIGPSPMRAEWTRPEWQWPFRLGALLKRGASWMTRLWRSQAVSVHPEIYRAGCPQ